jgi:hypothetical protein
VGTPLLLAWLIYEEVFPDECVLAASERATAAKASDVTIHCGLFGFRADEFVLGPTMRTAKRDGRQSVHPRTLIARPKAINRNYGVLLMRVGSSPYNVEPVWIT